MNNYTTARLPLRQSENSHLLMQRILAPEPIRSPGPSYPPQLTAAEELAESERLRAADAEVRLKRKLAKRKTA